MWYFVPVVLLGLFPWVGFGWAALRSALAGGWARRRENADAWFLAAWAVVIFAFFSKSQSKLIPYILPVLPPLAVLIGAWLSKALRGDPAALRPGLRIGAGVSLLLAAAAAVAVGVPGVLHDPAQAATLRPFGWAVAIILGGGAAACAWLSRRRGPTAGLAALVASAAALYLILVAALPLIQRPGTKDLALQAAGLAAPGEPIYHYHEFFHDFTFYARRSVSIVAFQGELEPENDPRPQARDIFVSEEAFRRRWDGPQRAFVVARMGDVRELFGDPTFHYRLLGESRGHYLFSNRP